MTVNLGSKRHIWSLNVAMVTEWTFLPKTVEPRDTERYIEKDMSSVLTCTLDK